MTAGTVIQFRRTPEIVAVLEWLQVDTGILNQSDLIRQAIMEMAKSRGMPAEVAKPVANRKEAKKRRSKR